MDLASCLTCLHRLSTRSDIIWAYKSTGRLCSVCRGEGGQLSCKQCQRFFHPLCLGPPGPFLSLQSMVKGDAWVGGLWLRGTHAVNPPLIQR